MFEKVNSLGLFGLNAFHVDTEIEVSKGMPSFDIIGLGDTVVRESRERIRAALRSCGISFPVAKVTVNLAPADTKKTGSITDLAIAVAMLKVMGHIDADLSDSAFVGEVSLSGAIRGINGVLPMIIFARAEGIKKVFVPFENAFEASVADGIEIFGVRDLAALLSHFNGGEKITAQGKYEPHDDSVLESLDFADVKGQQNAKKALEIAAAGGHNVLMIGSPGSGKSMLAKRMPSILPKMTFEESIETTNIHSISGILDKRTPLVTVRPFRAPHHTISPAGLAGGGGIPHPGEISLAHNGLLFLDELPEFSRQSLEILRQPLEEQKVTISRASGTVSYPCSFMLIAAMNPCPCGYFGHPSRKCTCGPKQVSSYLAKISGPLLDRFDLHVEVAPVEFESISSKQKEESSERIRERVQAAREIQTKRYKGTGITCNARITPDILQDVCPLAPDAVEMLKAVFDKMGLSARAYDRILKVSRTIADMSGKEIIRKQDVAQAVQYRSLDRKYWGG
ncbi:MAG: YifB family Mg chelatase-like AAA ATPase [Oscillospiraceae bacterium]|nr:YifB family Mg chelatase-like AAA ATPase [Oscillospiraceae bacterium]